MPAFRLARHFSIVSATAIFVVVAVLMLFFHHLSVEDMIRLGERQNTTLGRVLADDIRLHGGDDFRWIGDPGPARTGPLTEHLANRVRDLAVLRVGVLNLDGRMVYSVPASAGEPRRADSQFQSARAGTVASRRVVGGKAAPGLPAGQEALSTYMPLRDGAGTVIAVLVIDADMTTLLDDIDSHVLHVFIALVAGLGLLYGVLYRVVKRADRTIKEQHAKLEQNTEDIFEALVAAKEADAAKSSFLATMSHELRTPLTSIVGALKLVRGGTIGPVPAEVAHMIDIASRNSDRLAVLIEDVLDISKIESGKLVLNRAPLAAGDLVERAVEAHRMIGREKDIEFVIETPLSEARVDGDTDRLMQVLANLLSNAAKFSPRGATVEVAAREVGTQGSGNRVRFLVTDHGGGIPEEFQDRVFQRFSQADGSDDRASGGLGLGLNIARAIVELHGGTIGFETRTGEGTTFHFDLPRLPEETGAGETAAGNGPGGVGRAKAANAE